MIKKKTKSQEKITKEKEDSNKMKELVTIIWNKRKHFSEVSGIYLGFHASTLYFHHIIPSRKCEQGKYDEDNIILLTGDEHSSVESNIYKYEIINEKRKK